MERGLLYKLIFILAVTAFSIILIMPTVGERKMDIFLEQGVTADQIKFIDSRFSTDNYSIEKKDGIIHVLGYGLNDAVMNEVKTFPGVREVTMVPHWAEGRPIKAKRINFGLDLQGGMQLVLMPNFELIEKRQGKSLSDSEKAELSQQALELLRNRVDQFGVSEPSLRKRESGAIEIQLPGVKEPEKVKKLIGTTGSVEYRIANDDFSNKAVEWLRIKHKDQALPEDKAVQKTMLAKISTEINLPNNLELMFHFDRVKNTKRIVPTHIMALDKKIALAGNDINKAWVGKDEYGGLAVHFTTTSDGAKKFGDATSQKNHGKKLAIVIDNKIRSAPSINVHITTGQALIQGNFTREEVDMLTSVIKEGALPVDLEKVEERNVGPSLGVDSITSGLKAFVVSMIIIMVFMTGYYKLGGFISSIGLILNFIFMLAILSWLNFTLTLPGIAGMVLTNGMSVDANIIIYERIKEELRAGKSIRVAILTGFEKAFHAIFDSNVTTLIAATILTQFGTGPIKGFAVTLAVGVLTGLFVSMYITKFVYELISLNKNIKKLSI
jgi:preprotein translocase subunit SecD